MTEPKTDDAQAVESPATIAPSVEAPQKEASNPPELLEAEEQLPYPNEPGELTPFVPIVVPILLELGTDLNSLVNMDTEQGKQFQTELLPLMRQGLFYDLGVRFPLVRIRIRPEWTNKHFQISLYGTPVLSGELLENHTLVGISPKHINSQTLKPIPAVHPITRRLVSWIPDRQLESFKSMNTPTWSPSEFLLLALTSALRSHAYEFMGIQETKAMLELLRPAFPDLVDECLKAITLPMLRRILRLLVREQFSICNLRQILEIIIDASEYMESASELANAVRRKMRRHLTHRHANGNQLIVYLIEKELEGMLENILKDKPLPDDKVLSISKKQSILQGFYHSLQKNISRVPDKASTPVILTQCSLRSALHRAMRLDFPGIVVLSFNEIDPRYQIRPIATLSSND